MTELFGGFKPTAPAIPELERHWARAAVQRLSAMRVMSGFPDGTFRAASK
ncbi:MAG TPA: S-layer homology domain-containing protein [Paenibacillus sp.]|nr:S-layer homology domain-containing protein [Paenibacillus sp.]HUC90989.1 S-layer homology domain-containing protein [Paenibacillus sp.]